MTHDTRVRHLGSDPFHGRRAQGICDTCGNGARNPMVLTAITDPGTAKDAVAKHLSDVERGL